MRAIACKLGQYPVQRKALKCGNNLIALLATADDTASGPHAALAKGKSQQTVCEVSF